MGEIGKVLTTYVNDISEAKTWHNQHVAVKRGELDKYIEEVKFWPEFSKVELAAPGVFALYDEANEIWVVNGSRAHIVSADYPVMQHADMLVLPESVRPLVEDGSAGLLNNGGVGWRQWTIKKIEPVKGDEVSMRFMLTNSLDGTIVFLAGLCMERVVCRNTHMVALSQIRAQNETGKISLKKTKNAQQKYDDEIVKAMEKILVTAAGFQEYAEVWGKTPTSDAIFENLLDIFLPGKLDKNTGELKFTPQQENKRELLKAMRQPGSDVAAMGLDIPGVAGTLWADLNVFTEYATHLQGTRVTGSEGMTEDEVRNQAQEQRIQSTWFGAGRKQLDAVTQELMKMVA